MNKIIELSKEEKSLIKGILDIEDTLYFNSKKMNPEQKHKLNSRKEAKELTLSILSIDQDYSKENLLIREEYFKKQTRIRINLILAKNKADFSVNYAGKNWLHHLVEHDDVKKIKTYLFKENIQNLSHVQENLLLTALENKNPEIIELLIHYNHPINENNVFKLKEFLDTHNYTFNDKIKNKINDTETLFLLKLEMILDKNNKLIK